MKSLPDKLRKNGFNYVKVIRKGTVCIYEQDYSKNVKYYEVFIVKAVNDRIYKGLLRPAHEVFPRDEDFGKTAWSCRRFEDAKKRFDQLVKAAEMDCQNTDTYAKLRNPSVLDERSSPKWTPTPHCHNLCLNQGGIVFQIYE